MADLTKEAREALRAALAKATPGPWRVVSEDEDSHSVGVVTPQDRIRFIANDCRELGDAHAIALAVNLAGPLLEAADEADALRAELQHERNEARTIYSDEIGRQRARAERAEAERDALRTEVDALRRAAVERDAAPSASATAACECCGAPARHRDVSRTANYSGLCCGERCCVSSWAQEPIVALGGAR